MNNAQEIAAGIVAGDFKSLARGISWVENEVAGYGALLHITPTHKTAVTGITGPPGAGKSTLVDALIACWVAAGKKVGVLCVDPSSPFNLGALLGDRIRMSEWYNHPNVYIRSLASRGALGGLHTHILEITQLMSVAGFDEIIVETVGVGQSEIEIAGLADTTVVVVVPEAGDEVQTMKSGIMEIAHIFVVNKSDRPEADQFVHHLKQMMAPSFSNTVYQIPIIKTIAAQKTGIDELAAAIATHQRQLHDPTRKNWLLTQKALRLIQQKRMQDVDATKLLAAITAQSQDPQFNIFEFAQAY
ncbi:MAG: methylmalonyl Co-A mutase-associated GTPase MeaB [Sediminibacterium sp.]|jgi:LAO/AO transport system kinase|nr:methylmalonyl Co-A mutase-associated GTPase MeaB [Sediminibacterium sp.]